METEVAILWVDDNTDFVESIAQKLGDWLDQIGLELKPLIRPDSTTVLKDIAENDLELIIIDYNLPGDNGDKLIEQIRKSKCFQDIVFYTGEAPDVLQRLREKGYDGVFYVAKQFAETRIQQIVELKLWRLSDPASVRGWIVADSIDLEGMVTELLGLCFTERDGYTFSKRFFHDHNAPIDFGRKVDILKGVLNDLIIWLKAQPDKDDAKIKRINDCNNIFKDFKAEIVEVRNAVAHQKVEGTEAGKIIKKKTSTAEIIPLDEATLSKIRSNLRKHYKNLTELQSLI